jgi:DNA-binding MarR family transcriptional regulator
MTTTPSEEMIAAAIDCFWETIPSAWHGVKKHVRDTAAEQFGITIEQFHILRHVRKGLGSVSELAEVKQISRSAISQALDALVDKGLITRRQDLADRRHIHLELTSSGNALLNAIFEKNRNGMAVKMKSLTTDELNLLVDAMQLLKRTFAESSL